jgi:branched-chain amino acid transport system ATP-binding protein
VTAANKRQASPPPTPGELLLSARDLNAGYGDVNVLWGINLDIRAGEIVALVGANGAGKTTLLRALSGLVRPSSGTLELRGESIVGLRPDELVSRRLVHVPEGRHLFPDLSVEQNLVLGAISRNNKPAIQHDIELVFELFPRLRDRRRQAAGSLSGGEQQMCALGRGMMAAPELLMVDEMSLGLAPVLVEQLISALTKLRETGVTLLIVEQDVEIALEAADRGYVLDTGHVRLSGSARDILQDPAIRTAFLGL